MLRRHVPLVDKPEKWLLVSQVEHARVSATLAAQWGGPAVPPVVCHPTDDHPHLQDVRRELLAAIAHHDDGWAQWEANPAIDPELGRPYSFLDLPREQSLPLWRDSVLRCRQIGPLAGWVVAGHFLHMLAEAHDATCVVSQEWQQEVDAWRDEWFREWHSTNRPVHSIALAEQCLHWLRTFDWLSLWFCCYCPTGSCEQGGEATTLDEGLLEPIPITFAPQQAPAGGWQVQVSPWPFADDTLELDALGYAVAAHHFTSQDQLAKNRSPMRLRWHVHQ